MFNFIKFPYIINSKNVSYALYQEYEHEMKQPSKIPSRDILQEKKTIWCQKLLSLILDRKIGRLLSLRLIPYRLNKNESVLSNTYNIFQHINALCCLHVYFCVI